jgi:hypothetical protein
MNLFNLRCRILCFGLLLTQGCGNMLHKTFNDSLNSSGSSSESNQNPTINPNSNHEGANAYQFAQSCSDLANMKQTYMKRKAPSPTVCWPPNINADDYKTLPVQMQILESGFESMKRSVHFNRFIFTSNGKEIFTYDSNLAQVSNQYTLANTSAGTVPQFLISGNSLITLSERVEKERPNIIINSFHIDDNGGLALLWSKTIPNGQLESGVLYNSELLLTFRMKSELYTENPSQTPESLCTNILIPSFINTDQEGSFNGKPLYIQDRNNNFDVFSIRKIDLSQPETVTSLLEIYDPSGSAMTHFYQEGFFTALTNINTTKYLNTDLLTQTWDSVPKTLHYAQISGAIASPRQIKYNPQTKKIFAVTQSSPQSFSVGDGSNHASSASSFYEVYVVDTMNPDNIFAKSKPLAINENLSTFFFTKDRVIMSSSQSGVHVVSIADATNPVEWTETSVIKLYDYISPLGEQSFITFGNHNSLNTFSMAISTSDANNAGSSQASYQSQPSDYKTYLWSASPINIFSTARGNLIGLPFKNAATQSQFWQFFKVTNFNIEKIGSPFKLGPGYTASPMAIEIGNRIVVTTDKKILNINANDLSLVDESDLTSTSPFHIPAAAP